MSANNKKAETEQCTIPVVGSSVSFYQDSSKYSTDTGKVVRVIKINAEETNPILEIKPSTMNYAKIWRTARELL